MGQTQLDLKQPDNENTYVEEPLGEVRISVRGLVEFMLRQGDIDNRRQGTPDNAMQEGGRIHRMIQRRMGAEYQAEVSLRYTFPTKRYVLIVEGRADGIIENAEGVTVDEIKGTYRDLARMKEPVPVHVAQAKCYAYIYSLQKGLKEIRIRMTYCNIESEDIRYFYEDFTFKQLEKWFLGIIGDYRKWADYTWKWREIRQASIEQLEFPFPYRDGQRDLVSYVYQTIYHQKKLFIEAPTGVGKTVSTIFPAVKAMGKGMGDRLFYLTAKTITRTVADDTIELLRQKGLHFKSVILTAKEKVCFMEQTECNPENCPYAKGHYDRINDAIYDMLTSEERFDREKIEEYATKYQVCPFEFCLDMSLFADAIIGDYNYLFDPHVYLRRFFGDNSGHNYLFLIDEAHNLLERGREMYSASLLKESFLELNREIQQTIMSELEEKNRKKGISGQMTLEMTQESETVLAGCLETSSEDELDNSSYIKSGKKGRNRRGGSSILVRQGYGDKLLYRLDKCNKELLALKRECETSRLVEDIDEFVNTLMRLYSTMSDYLEEQEEIKLSVRESILNFYFEISHFLGIYERVDGNYLKYTQMQEDGSFLLKLFCINPRENLKECMGRGRSSILFSATFLPIRYYKELLGGDEEDYEVYAKSVFNLEKRMLFIADDVTSKYSRRSEEEYYRIARYIDEIVKNRHGNYMVFCPSYSFLQKIYDIYEQEFATQEKECIIQLNSMSEEERETFLDCFRGRGDVDSSNVTDLSNVINMEIEEEEHTLIGFCVLGGIFSEGIDLKNDSLIGAIIVGTGIPQVCYEREIIKDFFDNKEENGFDYAYRYPGMNKVLQAAGRVIRTVEDIGIIALLDERFLQMSYRRLFPREWEYYERVNVESVAKRVERFWDSWL